MPMRCLPTPLCILSARIGAVVVSRACGRHRRPLEPTYLLLLPALVQGVEAACGRTNVGTLSTSDILLIITVLH